MTLPAHLNDITPRSTTTPVEQCLVHISNELAALAEAVRVLCSSRNGFARAHVSCLPPEILATVFMCIEESSQSFPNKGHRPTSVTVTHVCRHWRRVALECPSLWAFIHTSTSVRWMGIMLERSRKAALVVSCNVTTLPPDSLEQVLSQLPRIKVLRLHSYHWDFDRTLDHLLSQPAPLLQEFRFTVLGDSLGRTLKPLSDAIFQQRTPQLRSLELMNCSFSWTSCIFSGLRTLCVRGASSTLPELLPALKRMPGLERLALEQLSIISGGSNAFFDRVPLVRLKSIVFSGTIQTAVALFAHLALPDNVKIALNLAKVEGPQSLSDLLSAMKKSPGKFGPVFRSLRTIFWCLKTVVQFSTSIKHRPPSTWNASDDDVPLSIQFQSDSPVAIQPPILFDICRLVTQGTIRTLSLSSSKDLDQFWRTGSAHFPELEEIHVNSSSIEGLFAALETVNTQNADIAYRSLRVLDLENIDITRGYPDYLHGIITVRNSHHCGSLRHLRLVECRGLMVKDVQLLSDVIEDIDWDGLEEVLESDSGSVDCGCPECSEYDYY